MGRLIDFGDYLTPEQQEQQKDLLPPTYETIVVGEGGRGLTISLPFATAGTSIVVRNPPWHSYESARIYSRGLDRIDALQAIEYFHLARGWSVKFICQVDHQWQSHSLKRYASNE